MADHKKRFKKWQKELPGTTDYLVNLVETVILPIFEEKGFVWYSDFAGGDSNQIGANDIPLQKRNNNDLWPTVQIWFDKRKIPYCHVNFSLLPKNCHRLTASGQVEIDREVALVYEGNEYFSLCKGENKNYDCQFGSNSFFMQRKKIKSDINVLKELLIEIFDFFDSSGANEWKEVKRGYVTKHFFKS